ncbi:MAG: phospholipid carrier-dependent glycosyltransferase [Candidatus Omnitrophica bacterium]|nr:phospholipid carrier-dependent glycosyltransferase [Candidatus Omnitrophota bacterium]
MIILLLLNFLVIFTSCIIASRVLKIDEITDFLIAVLLLYFAEIVIIEMFLGIANLLYINNVFIAVSFGFLVIWRMCGRPNRLGVPKLDRGVIDGLFSDKTAILLVSIILIFGLVKTVINLINAPFGWDSLNYHFTFAVEWFKNGSLVNPITVSDDPSPPYYPINGSLYYLWLILPLRNVFIADLGQLPFFLLSFLAVFGISRKLGLTRRYALYASGLFMIIPNFFKQLSIAYVDTMVASLYLASFYFLLRLHTKFSGKYALLFGMSLGLCLGTKTTALPFSALLIIPFIVICTRNIPKIFSITLCSLWISIY